MKYRFKTEIPEALKMTIIRAMCVGPVSDFHERMAFKLKIYAFDVLREASTSAVLTKADVLNIFAKAFGLEGGYK